MWNARSALMLAVAALVVLATNHWGLHAQDPEKAGPSPRADAGLGKGTTAGSPDLEPPSERTLSIQEALQHPFILPFGEPATLNEVARHLRMILKAPVVLDRAALKRRELTPEATVQLELHGVRLKTGLKLLLNQVDLTYSVVPEDNLLIITDMGGSEDPLDRVLSELKALHRDLHDVQDSLDEVRGALGLDDGGPKMRKPTIIEELPEEGRPKPATPPATSTPRPRSGF